MFQHIFPVNIFRHVTRAERKGGGVRGRSHLPFFENWKKVPKSVEKFALIVVIYR